MRAGKSALTLALMLATAACGTGTSAKLDGTTVATPAATTGPCKSISDLLMEVSDAASGHPTPEEAARPYAPDGATLTTISSGADEAKLKVNDRAGAWVADVTLVRLPKGAGWVPVRVTQCADPQFRLTAQRHERASPSAR